MQSSVCGRGLPSNITTENPKNPTDKNTSHSLKKRPCNGFKIILTLEIIKYLVMDEMKLSWLLALKITCVTFLLLVSI